jgi:hypothetical protein
MTMKIVFIEDVFSSCEKTGSGFSMIMDNSCNGSCKYNNGNVGLRRLEEASKHSKDVIKLEEFFSVVGRHI